MRRCYGPLNTSTLSHTHTINSIQPNPKKTGEPSDAALLADEGVARAFYQDLWADDDAGFLKSASEVRKQNAGTGLLCISPPPNAYIHRNGMTSEVTSSIKNLPLTYPLHPQTPKSRRAPIPADMANDPASITKEALGCLLDMSVQGKGVVLGPDPVTGTCLFWVDGVDV